MNHKTIIGIGILLLISGCLNNQAVKEPTPISGAPYSYEDLSEVTFRFPMKTVRDKELSRISDLVLEKMAPEVRTFNGEKYMGFQPQLSLFEEDNESLRFVFKGKGYVDSINFDEYEVYAYYSKATGAVEFEQKNFGWWGIPTKYKVIAEDIARREKGLDKKGWPLSFLIWDPDAQGIIYMRFKTEMVNVDLESRGVVE